jgi:acyl-CoA hydrolase
MRGVTDDVLAPRSPRLSQTEMTELVLPQHANALGSVFGGTVMAWIDICAAIAAQRHTGRIVVTAAVDDLVFRDAIRVGDVVCLTGRVNGAFRTSVEVEVRVEREDTRTRVRTMCVEALLTFVALDEARAPAPVPPVALDDDEARRRQAEATERRAARLARSRRDKEESR